MQISGVLKEAGHHVYYCGTSIKRILHFIKKNSIDVVAYSVMTGDEREYLCLNRQIKRHFPYIFSVFGASHPTFSPNMVEEEGVDAICRGEGNLAFPELIEKLSKNADIRFLKNFWIKSDKKIYKNELRQLIENISVLPFPDYSGYFQFVPRLGENKKKIFISSLGCPFECTYCSSSSFNQMYKHKGPAYRNKTVDYLLEEIFYVKSRYPLNWVNFVDDVFGLSRDWLSEFSEKYSRKIGLPFSCIVRLELIEENYLKHLVECGCQSILVGIETGNESVRVNILNRKMTDKLIIDKIALIKKWRLKVLTFNIMGIPPGSIEDEWKTVHFNQKLRPSYAYASIFQPLPGTKLTGLVIKKEIAKMQSPLQLRNFHLKSCIELKDKKKIENLHKFFSLLVIYPFLEPIVRRLLIFPLTPLYEMVRRFYGAVGFLHIYPFKKIKYSIKDIIFVVKDLLKKRSI